MYVARCSNERRPLSSTRIRWRKIDGESPQERTVVLSGEMDAMEMLVYWQYQG